jgi:polysaccharide deacetylase 2 family uncharacterized protein YibQ
VFEKFQKTRRRPKGSRRGSRRQAALGWVQGLARNPAIVFAAGLGLGIVIGAALAVHHLSAPTRQAVSTAANTAAGSPPKLAPPATLSAAPPPATALAPSSLSQSLPPANSPRPAGNPAWQQFALAMPPTGGRPMIAIVIDDMGIDKADAARVIALPGPLTIAFMSYATELPAQAQAARSAGDEIWMHIPMEPMDGETDAGPNALKVNLPPDEIRRRLDWALARLPGIVGVNNHMGSRFTQDAAGMAVVMGELRNRGLAFLDSRTIAATVASSVAGQMGVPHIDRDVFIDNDESVEAVLRQLVETEHVAERKGFALAIGHPHPTTIEALQEWLPTLKAKGFVLVPASALVRMELSSAG